MRTAACRGFAPLVHRLETGFRACLCAQFKQARGRVVERLCTASVDRHGALAARTIPPHGEERRRRVSNHEGHQFAREPRPRPSRRRFAAPQDEGW